MPIRRKIRVAADPSCDAPVACKNVFIQTLNDSRLALRRAIPVAIEVWPSHASAYSYDIEDFGVGDSEFEAMEDLRASIVDLYFVPKRDAGRLGALPQRHWAFLRSIIEER